MTAKLLTLHPATTADRTDCERGARAELIRWRQSRGLSQERAALALGCSLDSLSAYERGVRRIPGWLVWWLLSGREAA